MPNNAAIIQGGPDGFFSTLPVEEMVTALQMENLPASISYSAGTFVCNNLFYLIQFHCKGKSIHSGFVHVPLMQSQASEFPGMPTLEIDRMAAAIKTILRLVQ
jgi:pyroglutamyl-peptidase